MLTKINTLFQRKTSKKRLQEIDESSSAELARKPASALVKNSLQVLNETKNVKSSFPCTKAGYECKYKKKQMAFLSKNEANITVGYIINGEKTAHICNLLDVLQVERGKGKRTLEILTKLPKCSVSKSLKEVLMLNQQKASPVIKIPPRPVHDLGNNSMLSINAGISAMLAEEKEWLTRMFASLDESDADILKLLLWYSLKRVGFREQIVDFLNKKKQLDREKCRITLEAFKLIASKLQFNGDLLTIARIGIFLESIMEIEDKALFRVIVELYLCMGYNKDVEGFVSAFY